MINIENIIKPENDLERVIIQNKQWIDGVLYPHPVRKGHPEGEVIHHLREVLANVDKYSNSSNRADLRLITLIHDTFKHDVDEKKSKTGENHHAMIARRFAEKIGITNKSILEIIELHDEAYNSWQKGFRDNKWVQAEQRANKLIDRLDDIDFGNTTDLYLTFYRCDNETGDKKQDNLTWFMDLV